MSLCVVVVVVAASSGCFCRTLWTQRTPTHSSTARLKLWLLYWDLIACSTSSTSELPSTVARDVTLVRKLGDQHFHIISVHSGVYAWSLCHLHVFFLHLRLFIYWKKQRANWPLTCRRKYTFFNHQLTPEGRDVVPFTSLSDVSSRERCRRPSVIRVLCLSLYTAYLHLWYCVHFMMWPCDLSVLWYNPFRLSWFWTGATVRIWYSNLWA